ncbi:MAG: hypothetical protein FWC39_01340 [Bacteroidetes bacterium]|nr:hypothetical protein [Bacteroidota bacterium]
MKRIRFLPSIALLWCAMLNVQAQDALNVHTRSSIQSTKLTNIAKITFSGSSVPSFGSFSGEFMSLLDSEKP